MENSQTATSLLTLLNNVNDLIVISNERKMAQEVMRCLSVYAKNNSFPVPNAKIDNFHRVCIDSRPNVLSSIISEIANEVVSVDRAKERARKKMEAK